MKLATLFVSLTLTAVLVAAQDEYGDGGGADFSPPAGSTYDTGGDDSDYSPPDTSGGQGEGQETPPSQGQPGATPPSGTGGSSGNIPGYSGPLPPGWGTGVKGQDPFLENLTPDQQAQLATFFQQWLTQSGQTITPEQQAQLVAYFQQQQQQQGQPGSTGNTSPVNSGSSNDAVPPQGSGTVTGIPFSASPTDGPLTGAAMPFRNGGFIAGLCFAGGLITIVL